MEINDKDVNAKITQNLMTEIIAKGVDLKGGEYNRVFSVIHQLVKQKSELLEAIGSMDEKTGIALIAKERREQIEKHSRTVEGDYNANDQDQLTQGAMMLLTVDYTEGIDRAEYPTGWDEEICDKMVRKTRRERLIIAGALIAAELDRDRLEIEKTN